MRQCSHTPCDVKDMELIAPPFSIGIPSKHCSRLSGTCAKAMATKCGQLVLEDSDHSTPNLSHWSISLVQKVQLPPLQCHSLVCAGNSSNQTCHPTHQTNTMNPTVRCRLQDTVQVVALLLLGAPPMSPGRGQRSQ